MGPELEVSSDCGYSRHVDKHTELCCYRDEPAKDDQLPGESALRIPLNEVRCPVSGFISAYKGWVTTPAF